LLFSDIEGSTPLLQRLGPRYAELIAIHDALIRAAVARYGGTVDGAEGDGYFCVFDGAGDALAAALEMQLRFAEQEWPEGAEVRVRMGLHVGEVLETPASLVGLAIHHAARIAAVAHGGQVLISDTARRLLDAIPEGAEVRPLGVHQIRDVGDTALFQLGHPLLRRDFPPLRATGFVRNNLPAPRTSMIGREAESAAVAALLDAHRLVTLTGAGGCGKTRLAVRVASEVSDGYDDGVTLVELAALSDPQGVVSLVLAALGQPTETVTANALIGVLRDRHSLIVLDNCEHLLEACAALVNEVLAVCPRLSMMTTSREPLGITGEAVYRVPSLSIASPGESVETVRATDAACLFETRVGLVRPGYQISSVDASPVAEICQRLDGIPLAIELAAARCRLLSPADIAGRLDDRFRLLTGGGRDAMPRQQTLLAAIDWSYRLLSEAEQVLLAWLAVFHGGAALDAVEAVAVGDPIDAFDVIELVGSLVDKSLVMVDESVPFSTRLRLPETIRQFATDRLVDRPDLATLRDRHAAWFGSISAPLGIGPWVGTRLERSVLAQADEENLAAALDWATGAGSDDALRVITVYAHLHPELREPEDFGDRIRAALDATPNAAPGLRAVSLVRLAWDRTERDPSSTIALEYCEHALNLARESGDPRVLAEVAMWAGFMLTGNDGALEAVAAADASGDPELAVQSRTEVVKFCDQATGTTLLQDAERLAQRHSLDGYRAAIALANAEFAMSRGDTAGARAGVDEALAFDAVAPMSARFYTRTWGGIVLADLGQFTEAEALLLDALALMKRTPTGVLERETRGGLAHLARLRGDAAMARAEAELALDADHHYVRWTDGLALLALAAADRADSRPRAAIESLVPILVEGQRLDVVTQAVEEFAACLADLDRPDDAARALATADSWRAAGGAPVAPARAAVVDDLRSRLGAAEHVTRADLVALAHPASKP
jgi:predicted ATPase/class 3 adenylate cyclase